MGAWQDTLQCVGGHDYNPKWGLLQRIAILGYWYWYWYWYWYRLGLKPSWGLQD